MSDSEDRLLPGVQGPANFTQKAPLDVVQITHIYLGFIISIGLSGNFLCVLMFATKALRKKSPSQYLAALAIADMGFLGTVLCTWLKHYDVPVYNGQLSCKLINYISYVCCFLSGWLICAFTFERFVIVFYPLYRWRLCTAKRARMIVGGLVVIAMIANSWVIVGSEFRDGICSEGSMNRTDGPGETFYLVFTSFDAIMTVAVPLGIIGVLNCAIAWQIAKSSKLRQALTFDMYTIGLQQTSILDKHSTNPGDESELHIPSQRRNTQASLYAFEAAYIRKVSMDPLLSQGTIKRIARLGHLKKKQSWVKRYNERRITIVLVTVSMCYLILNLPSAVSRLVLAIAKVQGVSITSTGFSVYATFATMFFYTQYSINFFLYSCQGRLYRNVACVRASIKGTRAFRSQMSSGTFRRGTFSRERLRRRLSHMSDNILPSSVARAVRMQQRAAQLAAANVAAAENANGGGVMAPPGLANHAAQPILNARKNCKYSLPAHLPPRVDQLKYEGVVRHQQASSAQMHHTGITPNHQSSDQVLNKNISPRHVHRVDSKERKAKRQQRKVSIDPNVPKVISVDRQLI